MSGLIDVADALTLLISKAGDLGTVTVPLEQAYGAILAADLKAKVSRPPTAVSAMDGYAVRLADVTRSGVRLKVVANAPAGHPTGTPIQAGEAARIFTGAPLPTGTDHIVIQENTTRESDEIVICNTAYTTAQNVRAAGIDFSAGETVIAAGTRIGAAELATAAAANHAELTIRRRPRVGILANGDELRPPGSTLKYGEIINSNPIGLSALITEWGGDPVNLGTAPDDLEAIGKHIADAEDIDIFVPVGGASVGDHDYMRRAFAEAGFTPIFEKIAVKPGKPTWFSENGNRRVLGLPGNPASAFVCAHIFLRALLLRDQELIFKTAHLAAPLQNNGRRETFQRAHAHISASGQLKVQAASNQDSSLLSPFLTANALIRRLPDAPAAAAGSPVEILPIKAL